MRRWSRFRRVSVYGGQGGGEEGEDDEEEEDEDGAWRLKQRRRRIADGMVHLWACASAFSRCSRKIVVTRQAPTGIASATREPRPFHSSGQHPTSASSAPASRYMYHSTRFPLRALFMNRITVSMTSSHHPDRLSNIKTSSSVRTQQSTSSRASLS